jgi:amino acid transporter
MVLFSAAAILVPDSVAAGAAIGVQGIAFWLLFALFFVLPYGLITAELGGAWPDEGGLYVWAREAFGPRIAVLTAWMYWTSLAFWLPSVFVLFAGTLAAAFVPDMSRSLEVALVLALIWLTAGLVVLPLPVTKWVPSATGVIKITLLLGLGVLGCAYAIGHGSAESLSPRAWMPSFGSEYAFITVIYFSYLGFELMSSAAGATRRPRRDVPRMVVITGALVLAVYLMATSGVLVAIPHDQVSIVTGVADALRLTIAAALGEPGWAYDLAVVGLLLTFVGGSVTWAVGCNHAMAARSLETGRPGVFGHINRRTGSPDLAALIMALLATILTVVDYALFSGRDGVFWAVFSLSVVVNIVPYLVLFAAFVVLRYSRPDNPRPYRVPGGKAGAWMCALLCEAVSLVTLALFFVVIPDGTPRVLHWSVLGGGALATLLTGLWIWRRVPHR